MLKLRWLVLVMTLLVAAAGIGAQQAEPRVALVIGNAAYASKPLKNPVNDARAIAATLRRLGFTVVLKENATLREMVTAVREFGASLPAKGAALIYYSGHGAQLKDKNYLIPIGADIQKEADLEFEGMDAGRLLGELERPGERVGILILDACRDNPFGSQTKSSARGLLPLQAPAGTVVAYATGPGLVADDNPDGANGLYTEELLKHLETPGLKIEDVFKRTREGVLRRSGNKQFPKEDFALIRDFVFRAAGEAIPVPRDASAVALVDVLSRPSGARIFLDGRDTGRSTPATLEEDLGSARERTVLVQLKSATGLTRELRLLLRAGARSEAQMSFDAEMPVAGRKRTDLGTAVLEFVEAPGGEFLMGSDSDGLDRAWQRFGWSRESRVEAASEAPLRRVRIEPFEMSATEVTVAQYSAFCRATGSAMPPQDGWPTSELQPIRNVTWGEAAEFCNWATRVSRTQGQPAQFRLPSEVEWEYAACAGSTGVNGSVKTLFPWGDSAPSGSQRIGNLADRTYGANFSNARILFQSYDDGFSGPASVGQFLPNAFGVHDLCGNVREWCSDTASQGRLTASPGFPPARASSSRAKNSEALRALQERIDRLNQQRLDRIGGRSSSSASVVSQPPIPSEPDRELRVARGGSFDSEPWTHRTTARLVVPASFRNPAIGFRVAR